MTYVKYAMMVLGLLPVSDAADVLSNAAPWTIAFMFLIMGGLLRTGALETSVLDKFLFGGIRRAGESDGISAPGQLKSHYAPNATLRLNAEAPEPGEAWLAFGPSKYPGLNLSPSGDLHEAAGRLFAALRALDARHDRIAVAPIPNEGLGEAINDRLARAAHRD